jgi:DNA-binding Xre family transcriptional regulator
MATSYKKLWHILVDRNMKKKELQAKAGLTQYQMNKLARGEDITTDIVGKICSALDVKADDIMDFIPDEMPDGN